MSLTTEESTSVNFATPSPQQQDCDPFLDSTLVKVIKTIAYSVLLILSLGGNSLVIAVIYRNRQLRTIINFFILNISISDLLLPVFAHTLRIKQIYWPLDLWPLDGVFGSITCKLTMFAYDVSIAVSVLTLEVIAIERFFGIVFPMKRQPIRSNRACFIAIVLIWFIGALCPSTYLYSFKLIHKGKTPYCVYTWGAAFDHAEVVDIKLTIYHVAYNIIPFILLTSLYSAIVISLHRQNASLDMAPDQRRRRAIENRRVTYMLLTMVVVFLVTWLLHNIHIILSAFVWTSHRPCEWRNLTFSAIFLSLSFPAVNPFIYYTFNGDYRKGFQQLLCCFRPCKSCCKNHTGAPVIEGNINCAVDTAPGNDPLKRNTNSGVA